MPHPLSPNKYNTVKAMLALSIDTHMIATKAKCGVRTIVIFEPILLHLALYDMQLLLQLNEGTLPIWYLKCGRYCHHRTITIEKLIIWIRVF